MCLGYRHLKNCYFSGKNFLLFFISWVYTIGQVQKHIAIIKTYKTEEHFQGYLEHMLLSVFLILLLICPETVVCLHFTC